MPQRILRRTSYGNTGKAIAVLILALAIGGVLNHIQSSNSKTLYQGQLQACYRGNVLRRENNRRIISHRLDTHALDQFLKYARIARLSTYQKSHTKPDKAAADAYLRLRISLRKVKFNPVTIVDCNKAIPKP